MPKVRALIIVAVAASCVSAAAATAGTQPVSWSLKDMKTAIRAIGYPKPHAKTLACTASTVDGTGGQYSAFSCRATYPHHRRARFATEGVGEGGWICGGKTLASCKLLRHGFVTTAAAKAEGNMAATADLAAQGYLVDHDQTPFQRVHACRAASASTWACPYAVNGATVTVTITFKTARGGYVISGAE